MSMPFYVPPEQLVKDRAEYARKGIARGRSIVGMEYVGGVLLLAENPSRTLYKISEIYDRIAFAGVGKYNEFEALRVAGIRHADLKGYLYGRPDVAARGLANAFSQTLGNIFTHEIKPYEVEILVAEVGVNGESNRLFKVTYDGTLYDELGFCAIGGQADLLTSTLAERYQEPGSLNATIQMVAEAFAQVEQRQIDGWEAAVLDGTSERRTFRRLTQEEIAAAFT
ncbi:MAG: proteasome subunit alpha [Acidimicrobiia bacterium]|nr:proteasome subunit alpha [Acidimicrobiia bacterium]MDH5615675.1 proteasome subunit alpha [Acidimicrobiia bacterium]